MIENKTNVILRNIRGRKKKNDKDSSVTISEEFDSYDDIMEDISVDFIDDNENDKGNYY